MFSTVMQYLLCAGIGFALNDDIRGSNASLQLHARYNVYIREMLFAMDDLLCCEEDHTDDHLLVFSNDCTSDYCKYLFAYLNLSLLRKEGILMQILDLAELGTFYTIRLYFTLYIILVTAFIQIFMPIIT